MQQDKATPRGYGIVLNVDLHKNGGSAAELGLGSRSYELVSLDE